VSVALVVLAKAPRPGRVKTRLCPPCTPQQAAAIAQAALADTLAVVRATPTPRRVLVLDGAPGRVVAPGFDVVPQRGEGLAARLAAAFEDVGEPALLVGMDTPQLTPARLAAGQAAVAAGRAALGPADDGGYWTIGLPRPDAHAFAGVPMSVSGTWAAQRAALDRLGLHITALPPLRDVDDIADARAVARLVPGSRFAAAVAKVAA
jgi:uncharacterized protein